MDSSCDTACAVGCPIRRSRDPQSLALPPSFSQRATSFIASRCQGIHQMPFSSSSPTPSPKRAGRSQAAAEVRWQMADDRRRQSLTARSKLSCRCIFDPSPDRGFGSRGVSLTTADARASAAFAYPCPGPARRNGRACFMVTTRFTMSKIRGQRTRVRCPEGAEAGMPAGVSMPGHRCPPTPFR